MHVAGELKSHCRSQNFHRALNKEAWAGRKERKSLQREEERKEPLGSEVSKTLDPDTGGGAR
jgi:hypothetical protein